MIVQIISNIAECFFSSASFEESLVTVTYLLGPSDQIVYLPFLNAKPDCGFRPKVVTYAISEREIPTGFEKWEQLISFDKESLIVTVKEQQNLILLRQQAAFTLALGTEEGINIELDLNIEYDSDGPWFVIPGQIPDITCTEQDKGWLF